MQALCLARREAARDPSKTPAPVGQGAAHFRAIKPSEGGGEFLDDLVDVEHQLRIGIKRVGRNVGREQLPVSVDDIGTRPALPDRLGNIEMEVGLRLQPQSQQLCGDRHEAGDEGGKRKEGALAGRRQFRRGGDRRPHEPCLASAAAREPHDLIQPRWSQVAHRGADTGAARSEPGPDCEPGARAPSVVPGGPARR